MRACPICLKTKYKILFRQEFFSSSSLSILTGYDLAICEACGGIFANDIPPQAEFDSYYAQMSKYEFSAREGMVSETDTARFIQVADLVSPFFSLDARIVDVGCATGALLAEFKKRGFSNLQGYDPSQNCCDAAKRLYGLNVTQATIGSLAASREKADLIIMTGVLEHLADVDSSLLLIRTILKPGGRLYFEVPDASRYDEWFSAPYQFFSMEHVNFFTPISLANLLQRHGLSPVFNRRVTRHLSERAVEPAVAGLFHHDGRKGAIERDDEIETRIKNYLEKSEKLEVQIHKIISTLARKELPLAVWGAGTHTLRLMEKSDLANANIVAFLDSNPKNHGKKINGVPILPPKSLPSPEATILISSHAAESEIKLYIRNVLGWKNDVVCLYEKMEQACGEI